MEKIALLLERRNCKEYIESIGTRIQAEVSRK